MTNTYTDYPFTANGVKFVSRIFDHSPFNKTIARLPEGEFASMNIQAITEIIGDASLMTLAEIQDELNRVNEGATHAWILLGENK